MKMIGHVAMAVLVASPIIHYRSLVPTLDCPQLSDMQLLWWAGVWSAVPDFDIMLSRWTPIKHRGFLSHSLLTVALAVAAVLAGWLHLTVFPHPVETLSWLYPHLETFTPFLLPQTAALAGLSILAHLIGDSITKTGVPLFRPGAMWHFPLIGGHATFDSYALNMVPVFAAGYVLNTWFGMGLWALSKLGRWGSVPA